jgi:arylsulfatase A-like enzyme
MPRTSSVVWIWLWALIASATALAEPSPPNVVLFLVDDMGWRDCGAYGSRYYETPHIDRLAREGMTFIDAYAANPLCSPTRASILTGKYPARLGLTSAVGHLPPLPEDAPRYPENMPPGRPIITPESLRYLPPAEYTLAEALRDAGYRTGHFGKWHLGLTEPHWPEQQGYEVAWHGKPDPGPPGPNGYFSPYSFKAGTITPGPEGEYIVDRLTDEAIRFIEESHEQSRPFFAAVWQYGVHGPWDHKEEYTKQFAEKQAPEGRQGNPVMASMLKSVDESLGRIVARLDALGLAENTIVVFTSDNGGNVHSNTRDDRRKANVKPGHPQWRSLSSYRKYAGHLPPTNNHPLRSGKGTLYEGGVRVPLIVRWPGKVPAAASSEIVSSIDFYPTLLELLKVPQKEKTKFDGISFAAVLRDPSVGLEREAVFNYFPHGGPSKPPGVTVRQGKWKLIRWFETGPDYPSLYELYDLEADLGETTNLAQQHPERVRELDALIDGFLKDTGAAIPKPNPRFKIDPLQGWIPKACDASIAGDVLRVAGAGRRPFLATTRVQEAGPLELRVRLRSEAGGEILAQWRMSMRSRRALGSRA